MCSRDHTETRLIITLLGIYATSLSPFPFLKGRQLSLLNSIIFQTVNWSFHCKIPDSGQMSITIATLPLFFYHLSKWVCMDSLSLRKWQFTLMKIKLNRFIWFGEGCDRVVFIIEWFRLDSFQVFSESSAIKAVLFQYLCFPVPHELCACSRCAVGKVSAFHSEFWQCHSPSFQ